MKARKKGLLFIALLCVNFFFQDGVIALEVNNVSINIGYPAVGTLINGQVGQVLEKTNILDKNYLNGNVVAFQYGPPMMEALLSGKIDVALTSEQNAVLLLAKNYPCRIIATLGSAGRLGLVVKNNSSIQSIGDLKGKKITTVFGSSVHRPILLWLKQTGLTPGVDVELINMSGGDSRVALMLGSVDAIMSWDPYIESFISDNTGRIIKEQFFQLVVVMAEKFIENNPDAAVNFIIALKEAVFFMATHKDEVNEWYGHLSRLMPELIDKASRFNLNYSKIQFFKDIDITLTEELINDLDEIALFLYNRGLSDKIVDVRKAVDSTFIKKAQKKISNQNYDSSAVKVIKIPEKREVAW